MIGSSVMVPKAAIASFRIPSEPGCFVGHGDPVDLIWHQTVSENSNAGLAALLGEQIEVDTSVSLGLVG